ncbi:hypothetical protein BT69DRAFT_1280730 [Atractiella rhizophila]|nr:hypothetical protein BT69DRAFT_1280730 [Atractiella rhizophila]
MHITQRSKDTVSNANFEKQTATGQTKRDNLEAEGLLLSEDEDDQFRWTQKDSRSNITTTR